MYLLHSDGRIGYPKSAEKWVRGKLNKILFFLFFCTNSWHISSLVQLVLKFQLLHGTSKTRKPRVPDDASPVITSFYYFPHQLLNFFLISGASAVFATILHDGVMTPAEGNLQRA